MDFRPIAYVLSALTCLALPVSAAGQAMYRCGNNYQDTPCETGGTQIKRIGKASGTVSTETRAAESPRTRPTTSSSEASKSSTCANLSASMETLRQQQRAGGGTTAMERMSHQKRNLEAVMRSNGC